MPKYKYSNYNQTVMVPISFDQQILSGTFEHSINYLVDHQLDLTIFHHRFKNDDTGRPAYDPAILLKIVLLAYSRGVTSSRKIEMLCRENVVFMAISADSRPHFTTIADFISSSHKEITQLFHRVLMVCDNLGLVGKEMFAIDGCKLPSNASKREGLGSGFQVDKLKRLRAGEPGCEGHQFRRASPSRSPSGCAGTGQEDDSSEKGDRRGNLATSKPDPCLFR